MSPVLFLLAPAALSADDCPTPVVLDDLMQRIDRAESAYGRLDVDDFVQATDTVGLMVPCLAEPLTPEVAARTHRAFALLNWAEERPDEARQALAAARRLVPNETTLPPELVPSGHPLQRLYSAATSGELAPVDAPAIGTLLFDGGDAGRPVDEATFAQWVVDAVPRWSLYLRPDEPLPAYPTTTPAPTEPAAVAGTEEAAPVPMPPPARSRGLSTALWATAGVGAVGALGLYGGAWATNASFHQFQPEPGAGASARDTLESKQATAAGLTAGAISLGVVAVGSGIAALVVP